MTTYTDRQKACIRDVLTSMECTAQWLENGCDPKEAAAEIRLAMSRLTVESTSPITGFSEPDGGADVRGERDEREITCSAIDGAMAFGYQNTNRPPSDDHWLAKYWKIGRKQAELECWHDAVLNACMVRESCYVEADAAKSVQQLLQWESLAALDQTNPVASPITAFSEPAGAGDVRIPDAKRDELIGALLASLEKSDQRETDFYLVRSFIGDLGLAGACRFCGTTTNREDCKGLNCCKDRQYEPSQAAAPAVDVAAEDAYVIKRLSGVLAQLAGIILGDESDMPAADMLDKLPEAAQVLKLELDLYRSTAAASKPAASAALHCINCGLAGDPKCGCGKWRHVANAAPSTAAQGATFDFPTLVNRFLTWPLPESLVADRCVSEIGYQFPRSGTNLLDGQQAEAMLRHVLAAPTPVADSGAMTDERLTELAVDHLHIDYDRMPAGVVPLLRAAIGLATAPAALTDEQRGELEHIERCDPSLLLHHIEHDTAYDEKILARVFELAKERTRALLAAAKPVSVDAPTAAVDAWAEGAKFALRAVAKHDLCFLTDNMKLTAIKLATDACVAEKSRIATPASDSATPNETGASE